jgi:glycine/D-amino acid oxidase-like deaminating enzyme
MSEFPAKANVVIIGAGIVGNSLVYHLAKKGWTDMVLIDKGPLPNPGGSTGHASNFIFPVDHSKEMTHLTLDSIEQYKELGVLTECGGIEVARTEERMEELRRRMASSKAWGVESYLLTPGRGREAGSLRRYRHHFGWFLHPLRLCRRFAAGGHDYARTGH